VKKFLLALCLVTACTHATTKTTTTAAPIGAPPVETPKPESPPVLKGLEKGKGGQIALTMTIFRQEPCNNQNGFWLRRQICWLSKGRTAWAEPEEEETLAQTFNCTSQQASNNTLRNFNNSYGLHLTVV